MSRLLFAAALLAMVCLVAQDASAHHPAHRHFVNQGQQAAPGGGQNSGVGTGFNANPYAAYGYGPGYGFFPGYTPMIYPGVGYVSLTVPGAYPMINTQSYFNSPAYGHWNGFGMGN